MAPRKNTILYPGQWGKSKGIPRNPGYTLGIPLGRPNFFKINENVKKVGNFLTAADKSFTYATKIVGTIPGVGRVSKGSIDFLKEVARRKGMYVTTSHDGVYTDPSSCFGCIHF